MPKPHSITFRHPDRATYDKWVRLVQAEQVKRKQRPSVSARIRELIEKDMARMERNRRG